MSSSKVYKTLSGGQKKPIREVIGHVLIILIILCMPVIAVVGSSHNILGIVVVTLFALLVLIFYVKSAVRQIKEEQQRIDKRHRMIEAMSEAEFEELDAQTEAAQCHYGTFYLLNDHMYVPSARFLIRYSNIRRFETEIHTVRGNRNRRRRVGAYLNITDEEGIIFRLDVKEWKEYLKADTAFRDMIKEKISEQAGRLR